MSVKRLPSQNSKSNLLRTSYVQDKTPQIPPGTNHPLLPPRCPPFRLRNPVLPPAPPPLLPKFHVKASPPPLPPRCPPFGLRASPPTLPPRCPPFRQGNPALPAALQIFPVVKDLPPPLPPRCPRFWQREPVLPPTLLSLEGSHPPLPPRCPPFWQRIPVLPPTLLPPEASPPPLPPGYPTFRRSPVFPTVIQKVPQHRQGSPLQHRSSSAPPGGVPAHRTTVSFRGSGCLSPSGGPTPPSLSPSRGPLTPTASERSPLDPKLQCSPAFQNDLKTSFSSDSSTPQNR